MFAGFAKRAAPIAALAMSVGLSGCWVPGSGNWERVDGVPLAELDTSGDAPDTIWLAGPDKVVITEGDTLSITLDGDDEAGEAMRFEREGSRLSIARDPEVYDGRGEAIVRITMPAAANLEIAGSGEIEADTVASSAELEIAGSGDITVANVDSESLEVEIAGSGDVRAAGRTQRLSVEIAGSGNVDLSELMSDDVSVGIAGSGDVRLASNGTVDANIAGSGNVTVIGSASCSVSSAGSGSVNCRPAETASADEATEVAEADADADTDAADE